MYNQRKATAVEPPTVRAIVALYLREHGYDGLAGDVGCLACGCATDGLFPCGSTASGDCIAAYHRPATQEDVDEGMANEVGRMIFSPKKEW
jgi:hypothetical protein